MSRSSRPPASPDDLIAVGIVRRSHGIRGEMSVEILTDTPERYAELGEVFLVSPDRRQVRATRVRSARVHGDRGLVQVEGIDSPEAVAPLRNWTLEIHPDDARALDEDEYFLHDLVGLQVVDPEGNALGQVTSVEEGGGGFLLAVRKPAGGSFDLPFAASICRSVDLGAGTITVVLPEGLDDLASVEEVSASPTRPAREANRDPEASRLRIDFVTIFPGMFAPLLEEGVVARAVKAGILRVKVWNLREFTTDRHQTTDDVAYGGGAGMVMLAEPVFRCVEAIRAEGPAGATPRILLPSPQGPRFDHERARGLAGDSWLVFLCGRYEGIDERIREALVTEELSIGDFVVSGGELPAMLMADAVSRLVEGVVGDWNSVEADSFYGGLLDHPHYTRPAEWRGMSVPPVLLSGHAENIRKWRKEQALRATLAKRPDLLREEWLDDEGRAMLAELRGEPAPQRSRLKRKRN